MTEENKLVIVEKILIYILIAMSLTYGLYIFGRGVLAAMDLISSDGLNTPYYLIFGTFLITISILYILRKLIDKAARK